MNIGKDQTCGSHHLSSLFRKDRAIGDHSARLDHNTLTDHGTVSRGVCQYKDGMLTEIVERTKIAYEGGRIYYIEDGKEFDLDPNTLVSMNLWGFTPAYLEACKERFLAFLDKNVP